MYLVSWEYILSLTAHLLLHSILSQSIGAWNNHLISHSLGGGWTRIVLFLVLIHLQDGSWGWSHLKASWLTGPVPRLDVCRSWDWGLSTWPYHVARMGFFTAGAVTTPERPRSVGKGQLPLSSASFHMKIYSVWFHFLIFKERLKFKVLMWNLI